jgi:hypothetical protein
LLRREGYVAAVGDGQGGFVARGGGGADDEVGRGEGDGVAFEFDLEAVGAVGPEVVDGDIAGEGGGPFEVDLDAGDGLVGAGIDDIDADLTGDGELHPDAGGVFGDVADHGPGDEIDVCGGGRAKEEGQGGEGGEGARAEGGRNHGLTVWA